MRRLIDILFSILCITILSPLFIIIALLIKYESAGPIIFKQKRVGKNELPFNLYKFRSMRLHHEQPMELGPIKHKHALVTRIGYIIRRFKLDETPQFFNILKGDMSLIGPRPTLYARVAEMNAREKHRFNVLPGLTGWAEVNGNVELTWDEQLVLDLWYVDHQTFFLDMIIFLKTIYTVFFGCIKNQIALQKATKHVRILYENSRDSASS